MIDENLVKYYAKEISLIMDHAEEVQRGEHSISFKELAKIQAYEEILSLISDEGEEDD